MRVRHAAFGARLTKACDDAGVPPRNFGRLNWIRVGLSRQFGRQITAEAVRKWLAGETLPRTATLRSLASLLSVDPGWLYSGTASGVAEETAPFDHVGSQGAPTDIGQDFLDRIRKRFAGTVTIMPGVDLTDPTWEEADAVHE